MKFPKMVYLAKDNYRIVQNEIELEDAYNKAYVDHWLQCVDKDRLKEVEVFAEKVSEKANEIAKISDKKVKNVYRK
jgi:hypothetical protein